LTRKEFYELAARCREVAQELARHDQGRVSLRHCHEFNRWLPHLKAYDLLAADLRNLRPARPVARWQVLVLAGVFGLILMLAAPAWASRVSPAVWSSSTVFGLIILYFIPERVYGTTIELLEGKLLRVVDALDRLLTSGQVEFSEAAFFQVRENLEAARRELRQQIDLAHRRWR
jgi:hypothetical protein